MKIAILGFVLATIASVSAMAAPSGLEDPEGVVVQELVVRAGAGPAWWTVERGGSVVHILGLPDEPVPKGLKWDQRTLQRLLAGSSVLIVPVEAKWGLLDIPTAMGWRAKLKSHAPMEQGLPAPLAARFAAARTRLGKPASRYAGWDPIVAGQLIGGDFHDAARTNPREPLGTIRSLASRQGVPIRPGGKFRIVSFVSPVIKNLTPELSQTCLAEMLDEVDAGIPALTAEGDAWARGDVAAVLAGPRGAAGCFLLLQGGAALWRQTMTQYADAISAALQKPGHAVAVLPIRNLIARDGVLERLKARGFEVRGRAG